MNWLKPILAAGALLYTGLASALTPCYLPGLAERVECGIVHVPEDRAKPTGRRIAIHFARVPATARPAAPDPLLVLAGGPGQGAMDYGALVSTTFGQVRKRRDIVLIDQRGTGRSGALACALSHGAMGKGDIGAVQAELRICLAGLKADPRHYHTSAALPDFEAVREALGYASVNLWGGSYGTRTALLYARHYPERIRSMVLDSVAAPETRILLSSRHSQAALERMLGDCKAEPACAQAYPNLARELEQVLAMASIGAYSRQEFVQLLRGALYDPTQASVLPYAIHAAAQGRTRPLKGFLDAVVSWSVDTMKLGMTFSAMCTEEAPYLDRASMNADAQGSVFGDGYAHTWREWCRVWPAASPAPGFAKPVASAVPTLLFAGGIDPVTPPAAARAAARSLSRSQVLVAPNASHTFTATGCAPRLTADFIERPDPAAIDGACLAGISRPPFVLADGQGRL